MSEMTSPGPETDLRRDYESVCVHTRKIFDSCQSRDCIEDLRFYPTQTSQETINRAQSVKAGRAELLYVYIDVEPVAFNRGYYTVDLRYFYRVTLNAYCASPRPVEVEGLCVFDKRVILFGSEGNAKIFSSPFQGDGTDPQQLAQCSKPYAVAEGVDPIVLDAKLVENCKINCCGCNICEVPGCVSRCFGGELTAADDNRRVLVTLGQFSIVRLERDAQLMIPVYDYCIPEKECCDGGCPPAEDPCQLFQSISFPMEEFFPSDESSSCDCAGKRRHCN